MIDQIAKALMRFDGIDPNGPPTSGEIMVYRRRADAVLQAMETAEPTDAMMHAGRNAVDTFGTWRAMISAARQ